MDIVRALMMGLGFFGLLVIGSCAMVGYGTVAVLDKAAEVVKEDQKNPAKRAAREAIAAQIAEERVSSWERTYQENREYGEATDEDYSDFGEPSVDIKTRR